MHHGLTITELKLCGHNGAPVLHLPTAITAPILHHLQHFHSLRSITLSFWLLTYFDFDWRESEIIDFWISQRSSSTTLVQLTNPRLPPASIPHADPSDIEMPDASADPFLLALPALDGDLDPYLLVISEQMWATASDNPEIELATIISQDDQIEGTFAAITDGSDGDNDSTAALPFVARRPKPWEVVLYKLFSPRAIAYGLHNIFKTTCLLRHCLKVKVSRFGRHLPWALKAKRSSTSI